MTGTDSPITDDWGDPLGPHVRAIKARQETTHMSTLDELKEAVLKALERLGSHTDCTLQETLDALEDLQDEVGIRIEAVREDIVNQLDAEEAEAADNADD